MKKILLYLTLSVALFAMEKGDFAYESAISTTQESGLISVEIPLDVYNGVRYHGLEDVAVFDALGNPMPQSIERVISRNEKVASAFLPFTRLESKTQKNSDEVEVIINNKSVKITKQEPLEKTSYMIDSSSMKSGIDYLVIRSDTSSYMVGVNVAKSHDLKHWRLLAQDERLAKLSLQSTEVLKERIDLHTEPTPYLLIESTDSFVISSVSAYKHEVKYQRDVKEALSYTREGESIVFELPRSVYLKSLFLTLPNSDQMYQLKIVSQDEVDAEPHVVAQGDIYSIEGGKVRKDEIVVGSFGQYYYIQALNNSYLPQELSLHFTRERRTLTFLAQGIAPYSLCYGSLNTIVSNSDLSAFKPSKKNFSVSISKGVLTNQEVVIAKEKSKKESQLLVWLALFIGVVLLSFMSYKLIKERPIDEA